MRGLFGVSCVLAVVLATMATVAAWAELEDPAYFRIFGAFAVLDVLMVVLQPVLAHPHGVVLHLRLVVDQGEEIETDVEAVDFAAAASRAIRETERGGRRVTRVARV